MNTDKMRWLVFSCLLGWTWAAFDLNLLFNSTDTNLQASLYGVSTMILEIESLKAIIQKQQLFIEAMENQTMMVVSENALLSQQIIGLKSKNTHLEAKMTVDKLELETQIAHLDGRFSDLVLQDLKFSNSLTTNTQELTQHMTEYSTLTTRVDELRANASEIYKNRILIQNLTHGLGVSELSASNLWNSVTALETRVNNTEKCQEGDITIPSMAANCDNPLEGAACHPFVNTINFLLPYTSSPVVLASLIELDLAISADIKLKLEISSIMPTSFKIYAYTWDKGIVNKAIVKWIACPH